MPKATQVDSRAYVLHWIKCVTPYRTVRAAAMAVITSEPSVFEKERSAFFDSSYHREIQRGQAVASIDADFVERVLVAYPPERYPRVSAAAAAARAGTSAERRAFREKGFGAALEADREAQAQDGTARKAVIETDRQWVRDLSTHASGRQVRAVAADTVRDRPGDTDIERDNRIVQFFSSSWMVAAAADVTGVRQTLMDADVGARAAGERTTGAAVAAEGRAASATDEAAKRRAWDQARTAWSDVESGARQASVRWADHEHVAQEARGYWQRVADRIASSESPNWTALREPVARLVQLWSEECESASVGRQEWAAAAITATEALSRIPRPR